MTLTDPVDAAKPLQRLYPVYDEAGAGSLQVVLNMSGEVVSRSVQGDAYGDERTTFAGAAIDRVQLRASKDGGGALAKVEIELRSTEALRAVSVGSGVRIAGVDGAGKVVHIATVAASPVGDFTAKVTLTGSEWSSMTNGATALSIAATSTLRAANWAGDLPILPVPSWISGTRPVTSSAALPVEVRESLSNLTTTLNAIAPSATSTTTLYEIPDLALLGSATDADDPSRFLLSSPFQSLPFIDRVTHHSYARARWLNHQTGTFLTPDPMG